MGAHKPSKRSPALASGVNLMRFDLSYEEGLLAARLDGQTTEPDLALLLGWSQGQVADVLAGLRTKGVVDDGDTPRSDPYGAFIFPLPLMQAESDLTEEQRKKVIFTYDRLDDLNHYEVLQVRRRDDARAIKSAFQLRVKEWHPDRWPRNKGPFGKMIQQIFERVQRANGTLSNEKTREAYDAELGPFFMDEDDLAEMKARQRRKERDILREQERVDRRKRRNPMRKRIDQASEHHQKALDREAAGEVVEALREAQTAAAFDPKNQAHAALVERLTEAAAEHRIGPAMAKGRRLESVLRFDEAIECFEHAVRYAPENGEVHLRLAYCLIQGGASQTRSALEHAKKAASLLPDDAEAHYVLALCWERADAKKAAVSSVQRALELRPSYVEAKKLLKKLRWW